jgi:hypothetical protein
VVFEYDPERVLGFFGGLIKIEHDLHCRLVADVERAWLVKLRKERGLLLAVRLAGPFILSSQGKP